MSNAMKFTIQTARVIISSRKVLHKVHTKTVAKRRKVLSIVSVDKDHDEDEDIACNMDKDRELVMNGTNSSKVTLPGNRCD